MCNVACKNTGIKIFFYDYIFIANFCLLHLIYVYIYIYIYIYMYVVGWVGVQASKPQPKSHHKHIIIIITSFFLSTFLYAQ